MCGCSTLDCCDNFPKTGLHPFKTQLPWKVAKLKYTASKMQFICVEFMFNACYKETLNTDNNNVKHTFSWRKAVQGNNIITHVIKWQYDAPTVNKTFHMGKISVDIIINRECVLINLVLISWKCNLLPLKIDFMNKWQELIGKRTF